MPDDHHTLRGAIELPEAAGRGQALCLSCGLCCDGTLFSHVPVRSNDNVQRLEAGGIAVLVQAEERRFSQPCPAHHNKFFKVYENRPAVCRHFRCKLLREYEAQHVLWEQAQQKITQVFTLRQSITDEAQRLAPTLPGMSFVELRRQLDSLGSGVHGPTFRRQYGSLLVYVMALHVYLGRQGRQRQRLGDSECVLILQPADATVVPRMHSA